MTDAMESSQSTELPLVFRQIPRTLVSMSALEVALLCWQHRVSNLYLDEMDYSLESWFTTHKFASDIFRVPNRILKIIDYHIEQFGSEFRNFINSYFNACMLDNGDLKTKVILNVLKNIVFEPCGTIIDVKTAKKIITGDILDPVDQFELACRYSLEADIERLWPLVSYNVNFMAYGDDKLYYWRCRMRNELNKIPTDEQHSPEFHFMMWTDYDFRHWTDVKFLWHKLKPHEQMWVLVSEELINERVTHYLLSKLNRSQLNEVFIHFPSRIMKNLSKNDYTFEYALETWNFMKDVITDAQFFDVLRVLWEKAYCSTRDWNGGRLVVLLYKIWVEAPSNLKNYVLVNHIDDFFHNLMPSIDDYGCDLRFLRCLLSSTSFEKRNELWLKNWHKFLLLAIPDDFDKFMRLCLNEIDIAKFKDYVMSDFKQIPNYVKEFIRGGFSRELIEYLRFFSSDENRIEEIKVLIIKSVLLDKKFFFHYSHAINNFAISFIDCIRSRVDLLPEVFSHEANNEFFSSLNPTSPLIFSAEDFKECVVRCNLNAFFHMIDTEYEFNRVREFIDCVLSSNEKCLVEVKRLFYEHCRSRLCSGDLKIYRMRDWDEFSKWCAPSQREFRRALPVDHIFEILLTEVIREIRRSNSVPNEKYELSYSSPFYEIQRKYQCLVNFLRWYFGDDAARMFKLSRIDSYSDPAVISKMSPEARNSIISDIVNWFFDNDCEKIEKFYSRVIGK